MKINTESTHAKVYKYVYNKENYNLPINLCSYFWAMILAFILFIPKVITSLPIIFTKLFNKKINIKNNINILYGIGIYMIITLISGSFCYIFLKNDLTRSCLTVNILFVIVSLIFTFTVYNDERKIKNLEKKYFTKQDGIIKSFIKAKYNKYCPKINWE